MNTDQALPEVVNGHAESALGRWSMSAEIPEGEQDRQICDGGFSGTHRGEPFAARTLSVGPGLADGGPLWRISGPNIRADGSDGKYRLARRVRRAEIEDLYPEALAALDAALAQLQAIVRAQAASAVAQIGRAMLPADRRAS
jgi:hypothetical protein